MIKLIITDIDGVLTDGKMYVSDDGRIRKSLNYKDLDAAAEIRKNGILFAVITGENDRFTDFVAGKFAPDSIDTGCKKKLEAVKNLQERLSLSAEEICYLGDGKYDLEPIRYAGLGACPSDAAFCVREHADLILSREGGSGCLEELFHRILKMTEKG